MAALLTLAGALTVSRDPAVSTRKLQTIVGTTAARYGMTGDRLACLIRHLPELCEDLRKAKPDVPEALVSLPAELQYEVWARGKYWIAGSMDPYERTKDRYMIWLDLEQGIAESFGEPREPLGHTATELLIFLAEHLGRFNRLEEILEGVWGIECALTAVDSTRNQIEQQLTKIEKFSSGRFRQYLFRQKGEAGVGLKKSFADQYFIFRRLC